MTRSFFAAFLVGVAGIALAPAFLEGCSQTGVGDPCTPEQEYDTTFNGFDPGEVNTEAKSFQCQTRLCLVNHFQGRVSCPYGQDANGNPPENGTTLYKDTNGNPIIGCGVPGAAVSTTDPTKSSSPIVGETIPGANGAAATTNSTVQAQCASRTADKAVYCSCRCENIDGNTNDGANYCKCPEGFACTQLVSSIGNKDSGLTGGYCMKTGTGYGDGSSCPSVVIGQPVSVAVCDASKASCGTYNGQ